MTASTAIVDTNVVVAGLLTRDAQSPVARILDGMLAARFSYALSEPLLAEYRAVLLRPHIKSRHRLTADDVDLLLTDLVQNAIVATPDRSTLIAPDPNDRFLWDLLAERPDGVLVTGDLQLVRAEDAPGKVMIPAELAAVFPP